MDFTELVEGYKCKTCVLSVDAGPNGTYGNILIVTGNKIFKHDVEELTKRPFVDNSPYYLSLPKDMNFEDFIFRSAILGQPLHTYVNLSQMGLWVEMYLLPLESDKEGKGYCLYSYTIAPRADENSMSDLAPDTASAVLKSCIKLRGTEDFQTSINEVTADIRSICGASRCTILDIDEENEICHFLGNSHLPGFQPFLTNDIIKREFYRLMLTWEDTLAGSSCLIIKNEQDMKVVKERNPEWYKSLTDHNVDSLVIFPIKYNGKLLGYIWATNFDVNNAVKIKEVLELTTFFIGSEIAGYRMFKRLELLGTIDVLTGTMNRNAMNERVSKFNTEGEDPVKSLGIVFVDLNGLKRVNDGNGHYEGDRFLKKAAAHIREIFVDDEIYRAGGDEFMVLVINNTGEEFYSKVREMALAKDRLNFSMGTCFDEENIDINMALRLADRAMYDDKHDYYLRHPELKYR